MSEMRQEISEAQICPDATRGPRILSLLGDVRLPLIISITSIQRTGRAVHPHDLFMVRISTGGARQ